MLKHYDIIILGGGQIAQSILQKCTGKKVLILTRDPDKYHQHKEFAYRRWTSGETSLTENLTADIVINCIMPDSRKVAKLAIDAGIKLVSRNGRYVHLSTIAVFAKHRDKGKADFFAGDIYMRIKRFELKYLQKQTIQKTIIYPGIVVGQNTGWDKFFNKVKASEIVTFGKCLSNPAPIIEISELADGILKTAFNTKITEDVFLPDINDKTLPNWGDYINDIGAKFIISDYTYFPSPVKNSIVNIINSVFFPTFAWEYAIILKSRRRKTQKTDNTTPSAPVKKLFVTGMTNFHIGCRHVL